MTLIDLAQFGAVIFIAGVLAFVVKEFLKSNKDRDDNFIKFIQHQEDNFTEVIKNHLHTDTEAKNKLEQSHQKLAFIIEELLKFLRRQNNK